MSGRVGHHEGPSIWNWATFSRIVNALRLTAARQITPLTEEILEFAREGGEDFIKLQTEVRDRVMSQRMQCPAGHPAAVYELRASIASDSLMLRVFPNADGNPTYYIPIRFYFCVTCQAVYRQREVKEV